MPRILILNLPGPVLKSGSRWYNVGKRSIATLRYYPYPWFMGYATALLKKNHFEAVFKDAVAMEWGQEQTMNYVASFKPEFIVCEPTWVSVNDDKRFLQMVGDYITKIAVGNYVTNYPLECLDRAGVDYGVVGEWETSVLEFFQSGCSKLPKNFVSPSKTQYEIPDLVQNLDAFPFPERDDTPIDFYNEPSCFGKNVVMVSSRGCRLRCSFCNVECIYGRHTYRTRSAGNVVDEMEYLRDKYVFDEIYFDDDNMVASKRHIDGICREILARNVDVRWLCLGDGLVDDETLNLLAQAGCTTYKFGLEHLDDEVLRAIPKPLKKERLLEIIRTCKGLGMRSYVCLIVGLPRSSRDKDMKMIHEVIDADPDLIQIAIATPYPGTPFFDQARKNGWLISDDPKLFDATGRCAVSYPDYSADEIEETYRNGWRVWYRHVLLGKPTTLWFFCASEARRNGWMNTAKKGLAYLPKVLGM